MESTGKKGNAPTHNLVIGENRQVSRKILTYWTKVGAAWAHADGKFFIRIRPGLSVSGQIAVFPIEAEKDEADAADETVVQEAKPRRPRKPICRTRSPRRRAARPVASTRP